MVVSGFGGRILKVMLYRDKLLEEYKGLINLLIIRYEDLIIHPNQTMKKVYEFLGHDFKPEYLKYEIKKDPYPERWSTIAHEKIDAFHVDKWKRRLHPKVVKDVNEVSKSFMEKYKYEV